MALYTATDAYFSETLPIVCSQLGSITPLKRFKDKGQLFTLAEALFASRSGRPIPGGATEQSLAIFFSEDRKLINLVSPTTVKFVKQVYYQILRPHIA